MRESGESERSQTEKSKDDDVVTTGGEETGEEEAQSEDVSMTDAPGWEDWEAIPVSVRNFLSMEGYDTEDSFEHVRYDWMNMRSHLLRQYMPLSHTKHGTFCNRAKDLLNK